MSSSSFSSYSINGGKYQYNQVADEPSFLSINSDTDSIFNKVRESRKQVPQQPKHRPHMTPPIKMIIQVDKSTKSKFEKSKQKEELDSSSPRLNFRNSGRPASTEPKKGVPVNSSGHINFNNSTTMSSSIRDPSPTPPLRSLNGGYSTSQNSQIKGTLTLRRPSSAGSVSSSQKVSLSDSTTTQPNGSNLLYSVNFDKKKSIRFSQATQQSNRFSSPNPRATFHQASDFSSTLSNNQMKPSAYNQESKYAIAILKPSKLQPLTSEQEEIVQWMKAIGLIICDKQLQGDEPTAHEVCETFRSGVFLCQLVERCEKIEIKGIDKLPSKAASVQNNINKALGILRKRKNMNPTYLWSTEDIAKGDSDVIWGILNDIFKEYAGVNWRRYAPRKKIKPTATRYEIDIPRAGPFEDENRFIEGTHTAAVMQTQIPTDVSKEILCTKQMRQEVKQWLHKINFDVLLTSKSGHAITDILRNGIFLCELVSALEGEQIKGVNRNPLILDDARANIDRAIRVLRKKGTIPPIYLYNNEAILMGNEEAFWGLLYYIMKSYPKAEVDPKFHYSKPLSLYDPESMKKLEQSILFWLVSLGIGAAQTNNPNQPYPNSIEEIKPKIQNGTLLCELVSLIEGKKIIGINTTPKVASACIANITKALEILRKRKGMNPSFLFSENELLNGDVNVILGLLEDIHRAFDNYPPRSQVKGPYFGSQPDFVFKSFVQRDPNASTLLFNKSTELKTKDKAQVPATPPTELRPLLPTPSKYTSSNLLNRSYPEPFLPSSMLNSVLLPPPSEFLEPTPAGDPETSKSVSLQKGLTRVNSFHGSMEVKHTNLFKWLESNGIKLKSASMLDGPIIHDFSTGELLCELIGNLEHQAVESVCKNPKKHANYLFNVKKALDRLKKRKNMPIDYLYSEEEIVKGNATVIIGLLEQMRRSYNTTS